MLGIDFLTLTTSGVSPVPLASMVRVSGGFFIVTTCQAYLYD